jgi:hypothetical protein
LTLTVAALNFRSSTRDETVIVERIEASPPLLGFSVGDGLVDVVRAVVAQRGRPAERPLAVLSPGAKAAIGVLTFDPFESSPPNHQSANLLANSKSQDVFP